ncbi:MAG: hydrogenase maturation nickel metallochaperone HypA [Eubacterium sp.]|nr:hydrogenase maturation nickel metallochaperone HypA [Eubacterium sp.]
MHEIGIVTHLAKTLDELAEEQHITKIGSVTLQVGEVSGIMTDYFVDCRDYFKGRHPVLTQSQLKLETLPAVTFFSKNLSVLSLKCYDKNDFQLDFI